MAFFDDNTSVFRMKRDFDQFVQDQESDVPVLDLDITGDVSRDNFSGDTDSLSVRRLLEKEKQIKSKESEYIDARNKIYRLEHRLSQMENSSKRAKLDYEQTISSLSSDKAHVEDKFSSLMAQIKFLEDKDAQSREKLTDCEKEIENQRKAYEEKILALQKEKIQMSDEIQQDKEQGREKIAHLKREMMRNETELKICQCELEETKAQLKLQLKRSSEISNQMKDCEELRHKQNQAEQKIKDLELQISRMEEDSLVGKAMKSQVTTFKDMEKENRKLNHENQYLNAIQENNLLLKEQHDTMKKRCERMEEKVNYCSKLKAENESLKSMLNEWQAVNKSGPKIRSPSDLSKRVVDLQNSEALLLSKQGELQTSVHVKEKAIHTMQEQISSLQQQLNVEKTRQQQDGELLKRLKRKLLLVSKERDGFKRILDTYEAESSVLGTAAGTQSHVQELQENVQAYKKQTELLEAELYKSNEELTSCKLQAKQLEQRLAQTQQNKSMNGTSSNETDQQTILHLREKIANLEKALEKCEADKYTLECRIEQRHLQGDYDPTKLKVLHFKMNPADVGTAERQVELSKLKEENEKLKQRIKLLEENEGTIEDLTVAVERKLMEPGSSKDIEEMRSQLATAELKNKRLMEAFTKTSQEIREVCYQLTGYKIDIPTSNQYRLTSMYADSANDFLMFKQNSSGVIEMLGTSFSTTVGDLMDLYLIQRDSIPAFLSAVTLELFSRQTMQFS